MPYRRYKVYDPRRYLKHAEVALGRRGAALVLLGVLWVLIGTSLLALPDPSGYLLLDDGGLWRGIGWIITGLVAIAYATMPQGCDRYGFLALYLMPAYRVAAYGYGFGDWMAKDIGGDGNPRGILGVLTYLAISLLIVIIAGWREDGGNNGGHE